GGKTAVDLGAAKNAVGAFHQPARVVVDPTFSRTESDRALRGGFAEVVKTALIGDPALFDELSSAGAAERLRDRDPISTTRAIRSAYRPRPRAARSGDALGNVRQEAAGRGASAGARTCAGLDRDRGHSTRQATVASGPDLRAVDLHSLAPMSPPPTIHRIFGG